MEALSDEWQAVLDDDPPWPALHMAPCAYAKNQPWDAFDQPTRDAKLLRLINVIAEHRPTAFMTVVDVPEFKASGSAESRSISDGRPYLVAAATLVSGLLTLHEDRRRDFGTVDVIFDTKDKYFRKRVRADIENDLIPLLWIELPHLMDRLGSIQWPRPEEKARFVPPQAADMLVWHCRRWLDEPAGGASPTARAIRAASPVRRLVFPDGELGRIFTARWPRRR